MKKDHVDIPAPSSRFYKVECIDCDEQQVVYSHATTRVFCNQCGNPLASSSGSKARIEGGHVKGAVDHVAEIPAAAGAEPASK